MRNPLKNKKGESLVEVVVSCAIFGILITMATTILMNAIEITSKATRVHKSDGELSMFFDSNATTPPTANGTEITGKTLSIAFDNGGGTITTDITITNGEANSGGVPLLVAKVGTAAPAP